MQEKRSRDQIKAQILALCQEDSANKTRIVYQVGLNFHTVEPYLELLPEFIRSHLNSISACGFFLGSNKYVIIFQVDRFIKIPIFWFIDTY